MKQRLNKMQKLVRFREFQESLATNAMHRKLEETKQASDTHEQALTAVDQAAHWKGRIVGEGTIDIGLYEFALSNEQQAVEHRDIAKSELDTRREHEDEAKAAWLSATTASRLSRERRFSESRRIAENDEKQVFDQLGDLLLSKRVSLHD